MGLIDRIRRSAKAATTPVETQLLGATTEHRERAMRLNEIGVNHPATVSEMSETGLTDPGGGKETEFTVEVDPQAESYEGRFSQYVLASEIAGITVGSKVIVRVDPVDNSTMMFWGIG